MPTIKTAISQDYLRRQENRTLLECITAAVDEVPDPEEKVWIEAARRSFRKTADEEWLSSKEKCTGVNLMSRLAPKLRRTARADQ